MSDNMPQRIQSYQIVRKLGEGGMGAVYEGLNPQIGRRAAIKVLLPQYTNDKEQVTRFFNEARASNLVRHPSLVDVYECGYAEDGTAFIIMEFLDGESLRARSKRQGILGPIAIPLVRQMATALAATHAKNIVHRDLKPDNVMLVADPEVQGGERVKILDFGIAKLLAESGTDAQHVRTRTGTMMGTPAYMSPEQCRGNADVKQPSDVYSLGAMLFELYVGRAPFVSDGFGELMAMHMFEPAPALSSLVKGIPSDLNQLVAEMLAKTPSARPTMTQVAERLSRIPPHRIRSVSSSAMPSTKDGSPGSTTVRYSAGQVDGPRRRAVATLGSVMLLLSTGGAGIYFWKNQQVSTGASSVPPGPPRNGEQDPNGIKPSEHSALDRMESVSLPEKSKATPDLGMDDRSTSTSEQPNTLTRKNRGKSKPSASPTSAETPAASAPAITTAPAAPVGVKTRRLE